MSGTLPSPGSPLDDEDDVVVPEEEVVVPDDDDAAPSGVSVAGLASLPVQATLMTNPGMAVTAAIPNHLREAPVAIATVYLQRVSSSALHLGVAFGSLVAAERDDVGRADVAD